MKILLTENQAINVSLAFCMGTDLEALYNSAQPMAAIFLNSFGVGITPSNHDVAEVVNP